MSFFAPPAVTAEAFTRRPDRFRKVRPTARASGKRGWTLLGPDTGAARPLIRAQQIRRVPLDGSGLVSEAGVFAQRHGGLGGPDGIAPDAEGCLIVAHAGSRPDPVLAPLNGADG